MPHGFIGNAAASYLADVEEALQQAVQVNNEDVLAGVTNWSAPTPAVPGAINQPPPHPASTAKSGGNTVGMGSSSNVVVGLGEYDSIFRQADMADDRSGERLYNIAAQIEAVCGTSFQVTQVSPRCIELSDNVKRSMGDFRSLTAQAEANIRTFANEVTSIG